MNERGFYQFRPGLLLLFTKCGNMISPIQLIFILFCLTSVLNAANPDPDPPQQLEHVEFLTQARPPSKVEVPYITRDYFIIEFNLRQRPKISRILEVLEKPMIATIVILVIWHIMQMM